MLKVRTGDFPGTAPICDRYLSRGAAIPAAPPRESSRRRSVTRAVGPLVVHRADGDVTYQPAAARGSQDGAAPGRRAERPVQSEVPSAPRSTERGEEVPLPEELADMTREEFTQAIRDVLREEGATVRLAPKWEGGTVVLKPGDPGTQAKEVPLDSLFHKIVMIRDRLRVLEQKINAHEKLTDAEKVDMQQYVTRCYGSLTTFNILFKEERDRFTGDKT
jgi:hypothetical protein